MSFMDAMSGHRLAPDEAALWLLGQAGCVVRGGGVTVVIDPYLTDSVGDEDPRFTRLYPPPLEPEDLRVDVFVVTHAHLDHLDPGTVSRYRHKTSTEFVAPHLTAEALPALGVPGDRIHSLDVGQTLSIKDVSIHGVYAVPTDADALDTTGYLLTFANGRSIYHSADTMLSPVLLAAAPHADVLLVAINGKQGNLNAEQAVDLVAAVDPLIAVPIHHDLMALNSEDPEAFRFFCDERGLGDRCVLAEVMRPIVW